MKIMRYFYEILYQFIATETGNKIMYANLEKMVLNEKHMLIWI